jgi:hypothetical protein
MNNVCCVIYWGILQPIREGGFKRKYQMMQTLPKKLSGGSFIILFKSNLLSTTWIKKILCQVGVFMLKSSNHDILKIF